MMAQSRADFDAVMCRFIPWLVQPSRLGDEQLVSVFTDMAHAVGQEVFMRQQEAIINRIDSRPSLKQVRCPTLVFCGREYRITPLKWHEEMASVNPGSGLIVVEREATCPRSNSRAA